MFNKILLCTDGSERSLEAAHVAAQLAKVHGSTLIAFHVGHVPPVDEDFTGAPAIAQPMLDRYINDLHSAVLSRTAGAVNDYGVYCETRSTVGAPVYEINKLAEAEDVDLIVMGARGLAPASASQIGSTSYGVAHTAHCPVLLCRSAMKPMAVVTDQSDHRVRITVN
jgi:nucleotide-binding universal stress UspA family protein